MNNTNDDDYDVPVISKHTSQRYVDFEDEMPLKQNLIEESKSPKRGDNDDENDYSFISKRIENNEQPMSHEEAKNLCQKMFPKLAEGTKLTKEELEVFYQFKVEQV